MSIGDINSQAKGSGARFNDGKVDFSLLPLCTLEDETRVWMLMRPPWRCRRRLTSRQLCGWRNDGPCNRA